MNRNIIVYSAIKNAPSIRELFKDQGKALDNGKKLLLARALADKIYIRSIETNYSDKYSVKLFVNSYLADLREVISVFHSIYILDDEFENEFTDLVTSIVQWKLSLLDTNNAFQCAFTGDKNTVLDEFSSITRFVEPIYICGLVDIAPSASFYYTTYRQIVEEVFTACYSTVKE